MKAMAFPLVAAADRRRELLLGAVAVSAGVHGGLIPGHVGESRLLGAAFAAAVVSLAATAVGLWRRPESVWPARAAAVVFAGAIGAYVVTRAAEPVDALGVVTKLVEAVGLVLALTLPQGLRGGPRIPGIAWLYVLLAAGGLLAAAHAHSAHGHDAHHHGGPAAHVRSVDAPARPRPPALQPLRRAQAQPHAHTHGSHAHDH